MGESHQISKITPLPHFLPPETRETVVGLERAATQQGGAERVDREGKMESI